MTTTKKGKQKPKKPSQNSKTTHDDLSRYSQSLHDLLLQEKITVGDKLEVTLPSGAKLEGFLLPRFEMGDPNALIIKLDNGYNIGIAYSQDMKLKKIPGEIPLSQFPKVDLSKQNKKLPAISIVSTGGTIASKIDYLTGGVSMTLRPEEIFFSLPELFHEVRFKNIVPLFQLGSEDMGPNQWKALAKAIADELNSGTTGVVVMHGTDIMHYSSAVISFMLGDIPAPVVFTGGQRSSDRGSFDGALNIINSSHVASKANLAEVVITMHGSSSDDYGLVVRGTKARKMHTSRRDTFRPINDLPLMKVYPDGNIQEISTNITRRNKDISVDPTPNFEEKVALLKAYPGSDPEILDWYVDRGYKGIVIEGTGLGHVPTFPPANEKHRSWIPHIERATQEDIVVSMTSQCLYGRVHPYVYKALRVTTMKGVVYLEDMLPETAYVKLGWALATYNDPEEVKTIMKTNLRGEISKRTEYNTFLV